MKLTPPGKDMNLWTILWVVLGCVGLYFGVADSSPQTVILSIVQIVGGVGMWVGFPSAKWLLIAFFCLGVVGRIHTLIYGHFHPSILTSTVFFAFLAVRFHPLASDRHPAFLTRRLTTRSSEQKLASSLFCCHRLSTPASVAELGGVRPCYVHRVDEPLSTMISRVCLTSMAVFVACAVLVFFHALGFRVFDDSVWGIHTPESGLCSLPEGFVFFGSIYLGFMAGVVALASLVLWLVERLRRIFHHSRRA